MASQEAATLLQTDTSTSEPSEDASAFKPSRRVRTAPGGATSGLFDEEEVDDALSRAPVNAQAKSQVSA